MQFDLEYNYEEATSALDTFAKNDINELRQWSQNLENTSLVPKNMTNKQLLLFYSASYGDVTKSKECIEKYYNYRKKSPELFNNRLIDSEELKLTTETLLYCVLPGKSCEGYDIIYHSFNEATFANFNHASSSKLILMTIDLCLIKRGPQAGYMFLIDMKGVKLRHLIKFSISVLRKFVQYVQEALPVRLKSIHVLNTEPILDKFLFIIKPWAEKKYLDMLTLHHRNEDPEKLFEIIPRSSLPSNYGGTLPDRLTLHRQCMEELRTLEPHFRAEEEQRKAASC